MRSVIIKRTDGAEYKLTFTINQRQTPRTIGSYLITEENLSNGEIQEKIFSNETLAYWTYSNLQTADCVLGVRR